jgi:hypothetical protein
VNIRSTPSSYADFFAMRDAAAARMGASGARAGSATRAATDPNGSAPNISLTKPARPVDPLQAASSSLSPIKGGRIDCLA